MKTMKKEAAAQARALGEARFMWDCKRHGETLHYTKGNAACTQCSTERSRADHKRRMAVPGGPEARNKKQRERREVPEYRAAINAYQSKYSANRKRVDPAFLGASRARMIAGRWRRDTEATAMPASYRAEQEAIISVYAECPTGYHVDHLIPQTAKDSKGECVAIGLHNLANLRPIPQRLNLKKASFFDPDNYRDQRPANRFPGGAFDPVPTSEETSLIDLIRQNGTPEEVSLAVLRETLDAKAREHEEHAAEVLAKLSSAKAH